MRFALTSVVLALSATCLPALAQETSMPPDELKTKLVGKKLFGRSASGALLEFTMHPDGAATLSVGHLNDTGTWRLSDTGYCAKWKVVRQGQEACFTVVRRGSDIYVLNSDGSVNTQILRAVD